MWLLWTMIDFSKGLVLVYIRTVVEVFDVVNSSCAKEDRMIRPIADNKAKHAQILLEFWRDRSTK